MDNRNPYLQDLSNVHNYDLMKDYLFYRLTSIHDRMINSVPHTVVGDIAITYHILFENSDDTLKSVRVTNSLFDQYDITLDQLHADAMESCPKLFPSVIMPLESVVGNPPVERDPSSGSQMFYISNDIGCNGAAAVFYPDRLNDFANRIGSDLYVIPSSQDECILFHFQDLGRVLGRQNYPYSAKQANQLEEMWHGAVLQTTAALPGVSGMLPRSASSWRGHAPHLSS